MSPFNEFKKSGTGYFSLLFVVYLMVETGVSLRISLIF